MPTQNERDNQVAFWTRKVERLGERLDQAREKAAKANAAVAGLERDLRVANRDLQFWTQAPVGEATEDETHDDNGVVPEDDRDDVLV